MENTSNNASVSMGNARSDDSVRINVAVARQSWNRFRAKSSLNGMTAGARLQQLIDADVSVQLDVKA